VSEAATSPAAPPGEGSAAPVDPQSPSINDLVGRGANAFAAARQSAEEALSRGHLAETHLLLSRWYGDPTLSLDDERQLIDLLGQLAGTVIYSTEHLLEPAYQVQAGETLETIAEKYRIPGQLLARINGLDLPHDVAPGQALKVVRGPFSAIISLEKRELALMVGGYYAGRFRVGLGAERSNMEGHWVVRHKAINPTYYGRDRVIDADDPSNPLGEHWIGLGSAEEEGTVQPFGIHGTYDPQSLDRDDPRGYIRLSPSDARDVHDILSIGSKVVIRK
jgi:LysM repeat protein